MISFSEDICFVNFFRIIFNACSWVLIFDMPILSNDVNAFNLRRFLHRALDPGSMYTKEFNHIPTLDEINTVTGRKPVTHNALDDCWDVVYAIRYKWL